MGRLLSFLGGAAKSLANTIDQDRLEQKRIEDDQRQFDKQVSWAKAAEAIRANVKTNTEVPVPVPFGPPTKGADGSWSQGTKIARGALLDERTADVVRPAALEDGPALPTTDPMALTPAQAETARQKELDRASRENAARIRGSSRGGSSSTKPKYELRNIGGRVMRINVNDPEAEPQDVGPASKTGSKEDSADTIRKKWTDVATAINGAEGEALRSIAMQYGMDQRGLPTDDDSLKAALLAQVDAEFGGRLKGKSGGKAKSDAPAPKSKTDAPDDELSLAQALALARKKSGGKLSPEIERKIRDAYGAN